MRQRKYTDFSPHRQVNVTSSYDYDFTVTFLNNTTGKRESVDYFFGVYQEWEHRYPKYFMVGVELVVLDLLESDKAVYYEFDRDRNKRFTDLRYHSVENVQHMIKCLSDQYKPAAA
jgi:hypothetical protein